MTTGKKKKSDIAHRYVSIAEAKRRKVERRKKRKKEKLQQVVSVDLKSLGNIYTLRKKTFSLLLRKASWLSLDCYAHVCNAPWHSTGLSRHSHFSRPFAHHSTYPPIPRVVLFLVDVKRARSTTNAHARRSHKTNFQCASVCVYLLLCCFDSLSRLASPYDDFLSTLVLYSAACHRSSFFFHFQCAIYAAGHNFRGKVESATSSHFLSSRFSLEITAKTSIIPK